ncbi:phosphate regulon transcriptional regulator PhoB [Nitrosospira multiformis]|uniref:Phosphate regulon transcriptional regulatory protein PhoB n=1 Tax=Nitrosospira multiformis (strain ATCC 25196 / NCIMB 11849 / C 71) TaxID=323848 RepID=Q2Y6U8_NITMU|nr:phosphate regulon transcriptional regulator PhoB [Nitrosospira multiformis]ABB75523.1 two component transcriptional regulator, winged helix family [Nitrosospira multiformis ATCC 25196]SEA38414.1 two component transcriptional regulator, winged helix family [Nitrosospira multiformis]SEF70540.1 two component transcriptional regulator, winged helix family [Nitrosospira multiformis ATCC 25196]
MAATILVVEDEPAIQELISYSLRQAKHTVSSTKNAEEAMKIINHTLPDLVLLDWMLPGMSGADFARMLRRAARTKDIPIIMLTARADESDKVTGLESGADDYITKPFSPRELLARIKAVLRRRAPEAADDVVEIGGLRLDSATHRVTANEIEVVLGPTEFRLLHYLMTHSERVHSRSQLLDQVWGDHVFVEDRTVDVHIRRLRKALENVDKDGLVQTVRGSGYRLSAGQAVNAG